MIEEKHILSKDRYKKYLPHTGSDNGLRYRIWRVKSEEGEGGEAAKFHVAVWPEPYSYENTEPDLITERCFAFSDEGYKEMLSFLNDESVRIHNI